MKTMIFMVYTAPAMPIPSRPVGQRLGNVLPLRTQDSAVTRADRRATEKSTSSRTTLQRSRAIVASRRRSQPRPTSLLDGHSLLTIRRKRHLSCNIAQAPCLFGRPPCPACVVARWAGRRRESSQFYAYVRAGFRSCTPETTSLPRRGALIFPPS